MNPDRIHQVLLRPLTTEKTNRIGEKYNHYVFEVDKDSTKREIKQAITACFGVPVKAVRTLNVKGKQCYFGNRRGRHSDWKKAYITVEPGHTINFTEVKEG